MESNIDNQNRNYWFVGAAFGRNDDQVGRFLQEGLWEVRSPNNAEADLVRAMRVGEQIAIKATFVQKHNLPFDNQGKPASVMRVKARGKITANPGDGERVWVDWDQAFVERDWYFYTYRSAIWRVTKGSEEADALISFAFDDQPQDIAKFQELDVDANREPARAQSHRVWIEKTLVTGRRDRLAGEHALGKALWSPQRARDNRNIYASMLEVREDDVVFHLVDNQAIDSVSIASGSADASFKGLDGTDWAGQPGYRIALSGHEKLDPPLSRDAFLATEPFATELKELAESGAKGLFYNSHRGLNQGAYLTEATPTLLSILNRAYMDLSGKNLPHVDEELVRVDREVPPYTLDDALRELFLSREEAEDILLLWRAKKNIVLQGPPGSVNRSLPTSSRSR